MGACICSSFREMHASEEQEKQVWNDYIENHRFCESCAHYNKDKPNMCYGEACKDGDMWVGRVREQLFEAEAAFEALAEYAEEQYEISLKQQIDKSLVFVTTPLPDIDEKILIKKYYPVLQRGPPKL